MLLVAKGQFPSHRPLDLKLLGIRNYIAFILPDEKFLQFDWLRTVVFQLNLKYLRVKILKRLRVVV